MTTTAECFLTPIQLPPPLWKKNEITAQTKLIVDEIRSNDIKYCDSFGESNQNYNNNTMRIISEPRLKQLQANNKLKSDRLARKAQLARVSRRKKARKMEDLRGENVQLKLEIETLRKQNQLLNKKKNNNSQNDYQNDCFFNEQETISKPIWMNNNILKSDQNMHEILNMNDEQISSINKTITPEIDLLQHNINNSKLYIKRLKSNKEEKIVLQQQIYNKLKKILTKHQFHALCNNS